MTTATPGIIVWAEGTDLDTSNLIGSGFTQVILSFFHIGSDNLPVALGLSTSTSPYYLIYNSTEVFSTGSYSAYVAPLNNGDFPDALKTASAPALNNAGYPPLSTDLTVVTLTASETWGLLDNSNQYIYRIHVNTSSSQMELWDPQWVDESNLTTFWADVAELKNGNMTVLASIGGGNVSGDWDNLIAATSEVTTLFSDLLGTYNLDGIDFDNEEVLTTECTTAVTTFMNGLSADTQPLFTGAPYEATFSWYLELLNSTVITDPNGSITGNLFTWWNFQNYEGSDNFPPSVYGQYVVQIPDNVGIPDAAAFLAPGWNAVAGFSSSNIQSNLASVVSAYPSVTGGFVWKLGEISPQESTWATAMSDGLAGTS